MCWRILTFMTPTHVVEAHFQLATPLSSHQHTIICAQYSLHAKNPPFHGPFSVRQAMFRYKDPHTGHPVSTWAACKKYFMFEYLAEKNPAGCPLLPCNPIFSQLPTNRNRKHSVHRENTAVSLSRIHN
jgi:hypothetical protein